MSVKYQESRIYSLIVGTEDDAVEINNLEMKFKVTKTSSNKDKKNDARVEIYNLTEDRRKDLEEDYVQVSLKVGYVDTDLVELFSGQVINIATKKNGLRDYIHRRENTNIVTVLDIDELYESLNATTVSKIVPAGKTVKDVFQSIVADIPEVTRYEMNGEVIKQQVVDGYPLSGSPRQNLDKLSVEHGVEWQIDQGVLYVSDVDGSFSDDKEGVFLISQASGLIERPEFKNPDARRLNKPKSPTKTKSGKPRKTRKSKKTKPKSNTLRVKILLNPSIVAGSIFKLEFEELTGYYKVDEVVHEGDFRSQEWYSTLQCTEKIE